MAAISRVVLIAGPPGSGKGTVCQHIAKTQGYAFRVELYLMGFLGSLAQQMREHMVKNCLSERSFLSRCVSFSAPKNQGLLVELCR